MSKFAVEPAEFTSSTQISFWRTLIYWSVMEGKNKTIESSKFKKKNKLNHHKISPYYYYLTPFQNNDLLLSAVCNICPKRAPQTQKIREHKLKLVLQPWHRHDIGDFYWHLLFKLLEKTDTILSKSNRNFILKLFKKVLYMYIANLPHSENLTFNCVTLLSKNSLINCLNICISNMTPFAHPKNSH